MMTMTNEDLRHEIRVYAAVAAQDCIKRMSLGESRDEAEEAAQEEVLDPAYTEACERAGVDPDDLPASRDFFEQAMEERTAESKTFGRAAVIANEAINRAWGPNRGLTAIQEDAIAEYEEKIDELSGQPGFDRLPPVREIIKDAVTRAAEGEFSPAPGA